MNKDGWITPVTDPVFLKIEVATATRRANRPPNFLPIAKSGINAIYIDRNSVKEGMEEEQILDRSVAYVVMSDGSQRAIFIVRLPIRLLVHKA